MNWTDRKDVRECLSCVRYNKNGQYYKFDEYGLNVLLEVVAKIAVQEERERTRKFNINDRVTIRPSEYDTENQLWNKAWDEYNEPLTRVGHIPSAPKLNKDGSYTGALWHIMEVFGRFIRLGSTVPFDTEILIHFNRGKATRSAQEPNEKEYCEWIYDKSNAHCDMWKPGCGSIFNMAHDVRPDEIYLCCPDCGKEIKIVETNA